MLRTASAPLRKLGSNERILIFLVVWQESKRSSGTLHLPGCSVWIPRIVLMALYRLGFLIHTRKSLDCRRKLWLQSSKCGTCSSIGPTLAWWYNIPWVKGEGLPYIPRVHLSEGSFVRSPLKWLWSEEPMVRRSFIPKFLYSESCYVPKIPYSERPSTIWILCYEDFLVRTSSSPKGAMFRTSVFRKSPLPHTCSILRRSFSPKFPQF